jgi:hypothetical protein
MKPFRRMSAVTILSLTLAVSVFAGHIETPSALPKPTPTPTAASTATTPSSSAITTSVMLIILSLVYR